MSVKGSRAAKGHGRRYSSKEIANALEVYKDIGPSAAARKLGIPYQTLKRWATDANVVGDMAGDKTPHEQNARSHAMAATRASGKWADFREQEALQAGTVAQSVRRRLLELIDGDDSQMLRAVTDAYDKLIANAERLSGQATERIQLWAQTDLDRELKQLVGQLEDRVRDTPPAEMPPLEPASNPADEVEVIEVELDTIEP